MKTSVLVASAVILLALAVISCSGSGSGGSNSSPVVVHDLGLAATTLTVGSELAVFLVDETANGGRDHNNDGDTLDSVVHVVDLITLEVTNLGLAGVLSPLAIEDEVVVFFVNETDQGGFDLNGDGDALDLVVHAYTAGGGVMNTGVAGVSIHDGTLLMLRIDEASQGDLDLNGDGDSTDPVLHLYDVASGTLTNLALALDPFGRGQVYPRPGYAVFQVWEPMQGNADHNSDGDSEDRQDTTIKSLELSSTSDQCDDMSSVRDLVVSTLSRTT